MPRRSYYGQEVPRSSGPHPDPFMQHPFLVRQISESTGIENIVRREDATPYIEIIPALNAAREQVGWMIRYSSGFVAKMQENPYAGV